jgi:hypothetical protein
LLQKSNREEEENTKDWDCWEHNIIIIKPHLNYKEDQANTCSEWVLKVTHKLAIIQVVLSQ